MHALKPCNVDSWTDLNCCTDTTYPLVCSSRQHQLQLAEEQQTLLGEAQHWPKQQLQLPAAPACVSSSLPMLWQHLRVLLQKPSSLL